MQRQELTWVEVSKAALSHNIRQIRKSVGDKVIICPCVKGNAYGHGLIGSAKVLLDAGADWLSVNALYEARALREAGISVPIYVLGYIPLESLSGVLELDLRLVVYNKETVSKLSELAVSMRKTAKVHLKIETGNNRQGLFGEDLLDFAKYIAGLPGIEIEGAATHFANIEDTTDHSYAQKQLDNFNSEIEMLRSNGISIAIRHCANSAATMIFPKTHMEMVRPGISTYGMWPSNETYLSYLKEVGGEFNLEPALTWKVKIAQIKLIAAGEYIGYGCSFRTTHETRLAIIPIGYYDGYDRGVRGAHVLIHGKRAQVRGRVCMNIIMVDVSDIPEVALEDEVVLIGRDGDEFVSAEQFGDWAGTINYEVTTRINERIPRIYI